MTLKGFIKPDLSGPIPPLCKDGTTYEENIDKAYLLNAYISSQTVLDESQSTLLPFTSRKRHSLESIHANPHEVEETLNSLSVGKAAGPDGINN